MFRLRARLLLARINLWRKPAKILSLSLEMKANTWLSRKISSENGKKETIQKWQGIAKEEQPFVAEMFKRTVNEEKMWADYLLNRVV